MHMTHNIERRDVILGTAAASISAIGAAALSGNSARAAAPTTGLEAKPLAVDPKAIKGLSEKIITSHYDNNYKGAVSRLNSINAELAKLDFTGAPGFAINGLKREQLI